MESLTLKIRLAVLWIFMAVAVSTAIVMMLLDPFVIGQIISGEAGTSVGAFLFMALVVVVPLIMAFLSVTLEDLANRRANIILGIIFTGLNIFPLTLAIIVTQRPIHEILIEASTVVVAALIAWYAWKWPKQEA